HQEHKRSGRQQPGNVAAIHSASPFHRPLGQSLVSVAQDGFGPTAPVFPGGYEDRSHVKLMLRTRGRRSPGTRVSTRTRATAPCQGVVTGPASAPCEASLDERAAVVDPASVGL